LSRSREDFLLLVGRAQIKAALFRKTPNNNILHYLSFINAAEKMNFLAISIDQW